MINMEVTSCYWVKLSLCSYLRVSDKGKTFLFPCHPPQTLPKAHLSSMQRFPS